MKRMMSLPAVGLVLMANAAHALSLEEYLAKVVEKNKAFASYRLAKDSAEQKAIAGDVGLLPRLTLSYGALDDKKLPNSLSARESKATVYSAELAKRFSTGTNVSITANGGEYENPGAIVPSFAKYGTAGLGVSLQQSLWKDAFGSGIRTRHERETYTKLLEQGNLDLQQRNVLLNAEIAFWEYLTLKQDLEVRKQALGRAERLASWMSKRVSDGIADRADYLTMQALVQTRSLQLMNGRDDLVALERKVKDILEVPTTGAMPELNGSLSNRRELANLVARSNSQKVLSYDAYLNLIQAKMKSKVADEVADGYSADLLLEGSYNTNAYNTRGLSDAQAEIANTDHPTSRVGVKWIYLFDTSVKDAAVNTAKMDGMAAKSLAERKLSESEMQWSELNRRFGELSKKIETAQKLAEIQGERAREESQRLNRGRSITSNVINAEQDAQEAELNVIRLRAEQRKLEAQTRMFIATEENI